MQRQRRRRRIRVSRQKTRLINTGRPVAVAAAAPAASSQRVRERSHQVVVVVWETTLPMERVRIDYLQKRWFVRLTQIPCNVSFTWWWTGQHFSILWFSARQQTKLKTLFKPWRRRLELREGKIRSEGVEKRKDHIIIRQRSQTVYSVGNHPLLQWFSSIKDAREGKEEDWPPWWWSRWFSFATCDLRTLWNCHTPWPPVYAPMCAHIQVHDEILTKYTKPLWSPPARGG